MDKTLLFQAIERIERGVDLGLGELADLIARDPDPSLPAVIFLPGFMGVHLADAASGRVWLDPAAVMRGDLSVRAALDATGEADALPGVRLAPDGLVRPVYGNLVGALRAAGYAVHAFPFDFRRSLPATMRLLRDLVIGILQEKPRSKVVLVGHSMGSLLACLLPYHLPSFAERVEQSIFLGGPLGGSFDPVEAVTGTHWILPRLVALSPGESARDFQATLATWPSLFGMLPDPVAFPRGECERVFEATNWPVAVPVAQRLLDAGRDLKTKLRESPIFQLGAPVTQLISTRYPTIASLGRDSEGALTGGPRTAQGDGVVTALSALPAGVTGYRTGFPHMLIPAEPAAIRAVLDLIHTGGCSLDPLRTSDLAVEIPPGRAPDAQMLVGLMEDGAETLKGGLLSLSALAWLFSPHG